MNGASGTGPVPSGEDSSVSTSFTRSPALGATLGPFQRSKSVGFDLEREVYRTVGNGADESTEAKTEEQTKRQKSVLTIMRKALTVRREQERLFVLLILFVPFVMLTGLRLPRTQPTVVPFGTFEAINRTSLSTDELIRLAPRKRLSSLVTIPALKQLRLHLWSELAKQEVHPQVSIVAGMPCELAQNAQTLQIGRAHV